MEQAEYSLKHGHRPVVIPLDPQCHRDAGREGTKVAPTSRGSEIHLLSFPSLASSQIKIIFTKSFLCLTEKLILVWLN
jgi:hypothetical protein